jgi:hypothetical protein
VKFQAKFTVILLELDDFFRYPFERCLDEFCLTSHGATAVWDTVQVRQVRAI